MDGTGDDRVERRWRCAGPGVSRVVFRYQERAGTRDRREWREVGRAAGSMGGRNNTQSHSIVYARDAYYRTHISSF